MRTVAYSDIVNRAAELAGRSRTKILAEERTMLRGFIAAHLRPLWTAEAWPELCVIEEMEVADRVIDRREGRELVSSYVGSVELTANTSGGTVTLDLSRTPVSVFANVSVPDGGDLISVNPVTGATKTGFTYSLTGIVPDDGYYLNYRITY